MIFHAKILGRRWKWHIGGRLSKDLDGQCDRPWSVGKEIRVDKNIRGEQFAETVLHEGLHAADAYKTEEWIDEVARDLIRILLKKKVLERIVDDDTIEARMEDILHARGWIRSDT